ncbi:gas vesicle protein GvpU [Bacillus sp. FJAT-27231]|uniref:gas vesicle accessory protein GvpU n=1 Tax=Bacillus sp. FJAT-27231 TaxID=1679168 RepID=UPI000670B47E|nr:gas vesicle accessory protein GvpU [Bacillus sp. FJAT-27231]KMY55839.1 gas vesicle protein GvpU [Bacillus sp. FJAT-27231]
MSMGSGVMKDSILEFFVQAANKHDFSLDITLNIKGAVVTGTIISAQEYFDRLSRLFEDGDEVAQMLSEQLEDAGEAAHAQDNAEAYFIHMKDTKVYCGDSKPTPSKGEILWRGKLSEIDGFFLGKIFDHKKET